MRKKTALYWQCSPFHGRNSVAKRYSKQWAFLSSQDARFETLKILLTGRGEDVIEKKVLLGNGAGLVF